MWSKAEDIARWVSTADLAKGGEMDPTRVKRILSIDGGGLRGIIPLGVLNALEEKTGRPLTETFQFVAGTSTGAIIAAGIAAGKTAREMLQLYQEQGKDVFPNALPKPIEDFLRQHFITPEGAQIMTANPPYDITKVRTFVTQQLANPAMTFQDSPIDLLITAKEVPNGRPWYFVKNQPMNQKVTGTFQLAECVTASGAAPFYFPPFHVTVPDGIEWPKGVEPLGADNELVDGGVGVAGNPVYQACVEAFEYTRERGDPNGYTPAETIVVSLGTGRYVPDYQPGSVFAWPHAWHNWLLTELLASPGEQQTEIAYRQYGGPTGIALYRLDLALKTDIDMAAADEMDHLVRLGQQLAADPDLDWQTILQGGDSKFRITAGNTQWQQYRRAGN